MICWPEELSKMPIVLCFVMLCAFEGFKRNLAPVNCAPFTIPSHSFQHAPFIGVCVRLCVCGINFVLFIPIPIEFLLFVAQESLEEA